MNLLKALLMGITLFLAVCVSAEAQSETKAGLPSPLGDAETLMRQGKFSEAKSSLTDFVAGMPAGWKPAVGEGDDLRVAYWDLEHFRTCAAMESEFRGKKRLVWVLPSYSKAYYLLAFISMETGNKKEAKQYIDKGLELEPDHPILLAERGLILRGMADYEGSVKSYDAVLRSKGCVASYQRALALRGKGISLIELGKLDEAEQALNESLQIVPNNKVALNELDYIRHLRAGTTPKAPIVLVPGSPEQAK